MVCQYLKGSLLLRTEASDYFIWRTLTRRFALGKTKVFV